MSQVQASRQQYRDTVVDNVSRSSSMSLTWGNHLQEHRSPPALRREYASVVQEEDSDDGDEMDFDGFGDGDKMDVDMDVDMDMDMDMDVDVDEEESGEAVADVDMSELHSGPNTYHYESLSRFPTSPSNTESEPRSETLPDAFNDEDAPQLIREIDNTAATPDDNRRNHNTWNYLETGTSRLQARNGDDAEEMLDEDDGVNEQELEINFRRNFETSGLQHMMTELERWVRFRPSALF